MVAATALRIAIRLRGRGPNADYMAALLMRDRRAAPPRDSAFLVQIKQMGYTPARLLHRSFGLWTYYDVRNRIRTAIHRERQRATAAAPALEALGRELLILPPQPPPGPPAAADSNHCWQAWRASHCATNGMSFKTRAARYYYARRNTATARV